MVNQTVMYKIKKGYRHREDNVAVDTIDSKDKWQREVYERAAQVADEIGAATVLDVGCGSGYKLLKHFSHLTTVGTELEPMFSFLQERYPDRVWRRSQFDTVPAQHFDIVICADVVEHIPEPDELMAWLRDLRFSRLFLSTPERRLVYGQDHDGPPRNPGHCREWTQDEFASYVDDWFPIYLHWITNHWQGTQLVEVVRQC